MISYILGGLIGLHWLIGLTRTALCWPAIRYEMTKQSQEPSIFGMRAKVEWILPRPVCIGIYSAAWFMWKSEYKDKREASRLQRLSDKTRNNP